MHPQRKLRARHGIGGQTGQAPVIRARCRQAISLFVCAGGANKSACGRMRGEALWVGDPPSAQERL